jgi:hypothetical protein
VSEDAHFQGYRDQFDEFDLGLCLCCEEKAATDHDPAVGQVCGECRGLLAHVAGALATAEICGFTTEINR